MKKLIALILILFAFLMTVTPAHALDSVINGPDTVFKESGQIVTIHDILLLYESEGRFLSVSNDEFTGNGHLVGSYNVTIVATEGLNDIERTIVVKVVQKIGDAVLVDSDGNIYVRPNQILDFTKIRTILRNVNLLHVSVGAGYQILLDEYTEFENIEGVYTYSFRLISASGTIQNISIKIVVSDEFTSFNSDELIQPEPNGINSFWEWLGNMALMITVFTVSGILIYFTFKYLKKLSKKGRPFL